MKSRAATRTGAILATVVMAAVPLTGLAQISVPWWVTVYPNDPSYLAVTIDTSRVPGNAHLENVTVRTSLFDANGVGVGSVTLNFWGESSPSLRRAARPMVRYFRHGLPTPSSARNGVLRWELWTDGQKQDGNDPDEPPRRIDTGGGAPASGGTSRAPQTLSPLPASAPASAAPAAGVATVIGEWTYRMQSDSGASFTGKLSLQQPGGAALAGRMDTPDRTLGALTGQLNGGILRLTRDTGKQTLQQFDLQWANGRWTGTYRNQGQYPDRGTVDLTK